MRPLGTAPAGLTGIVQVCFITHEIPRHEVAVKKCTQPCHPVRAGKGPRQQPRDLLELWKCVLGTNSLTDILPLTGDGKNRFKMYQQQARSLPVSTARLAGAPATATDSQCGRKNVVSRHPNQPTTSYMSACCLLKPYSHYLKSACNHREGSPHRYTSMHQTLCAQPARIPRLEARQLATLLGSFEKFEKFEKQTSWQAQHQQKRTLEVGWGATHFNFKHCIPCQALKNYSCVYWLLTSL